MAEPDTSSMTLPFAGNLVIDYTIQWETIERSELPNISAGFLTVLIDAAVYELVAERIDIGISVPVIPSLLKRSNTEWTAEHYEGLKGAITITALRLAPPPPLPLANFSRAHIPVELEDIADDLASLPLPDDADRT